MTHIVKSINTEIGFEYEIDSDQIYNISDIYNNF